ncbi:hypothetical protein ACK3SF_01970 [Candidatus Nanosalina sp. VS9-1]|uniref:hypothetical protein n=1 Tax=Candidatus Nanosalina sp. VS9-1 TaxID=3388566 RepID=UPI0039E08EAF
MRETVAFELEDIGNPVAFYHVQAYLDEIAYDSRPLDEDDFDSDMREVPEKVLEADLLNSARSYIINYSHVGVGPDTRSEVVEFYDIGDEVVVSGEGRYLEDAREILDSENPGSRKTKKLLHHKIDQGLKGVANRLGG